MQKIILSITSTLNAHSTIDQNFLISTSSIFFSLEKTTGRSVSNQTEIHIPSILNSNSTVLLQVHLIRYNKKRSIVWFSRPWLNDWLQRIVNLPLRPISPDYPNSSNRSMFQQNVTAMNNSNAFFQFHVINLTYSIHLEFQPMNFNLSYLVLSQFDDQPQLNSIENWTLFCQKEMENIFEQFRFGERCNLHTFSW